jgi:hypothetical protein
VVEALRQLSPNQRLAVVLHDYADRPVGEVAATLGASRATVYVHLSQGRRRLRSPSWRTTMRDLKDLLQSLEDQEMPDRWSEIGRASPRPLPEPHRSRIGTYVLLVAVLAVVGLILATLTPLGKRIDTARCGVGSGRQMGMRNRRAPFTSPNGPRPAGT